MFGNKKKVESFDVVTLWLGGMRQTVEWELVMKDGRAEVTLYRIVYGQGKERREPVRRAACDANEALRLLNDCRLLSWNGFDGPHRKGVCDGTVFRLSATVNGDQTVQARGSQNFPRHYYDLLNGLRDLLETGQPDPDVSEE